MLRQNVPFYASPPFVPITLSYWRTIRYYDHVTYFLDNKLRAKNE